MIAEGCSCPEAYEYFQALIQHRAMNLSVCRLADGTILAPPIAPDPDPKNEATI
jgi:hypothetical protein